MTTETDTPPQEAAPVALIQYEGKVPEKIFAPPAEVARRDKLVAIATEITEINNPEEAGAAQVTLTALADMRREIEKSRKLAKEPFLEGGREVDDFAKKFTAAVTEAENRLTGMLLTFNRAEQEKREKAEREAAEARRKAEAEAQEIERKRIAAEQQAERERQAAAEAAKAPARGDSFLDDLLDPEPAAATPAGPSAAEQAETLRQQEEAAKAKLDAANAAEFEAITAGPAVKGVGQEISIEIVDIHKLYAARPELVKLDLKLADAKAAVKTYADRKGGELPVIPGLRIEWRDKLTKR